MTPRRSKERTEGGASKKLFLGLLGLAGLGVGVWMFRSRRKRPRR